MNFRKLNTQQYERYLSTFGKKVLENLVNNLEERNERNNVQLRGRYLHGQPRQVLNFGDSYICKMKNLPVNESHNNTHDNNTSPSTHLDTKSPDVTPYGLLQPIVEDVMSEKEDVCVGNKYVGHLGADLSEIQKSSEAKISDNICVVKNHIEWDDIFDTQLLNDLNILDTDSNFKNQESSIQKGNTTEPREVNDNDLTFGSENIEPAKALHLTHKINSDCRNTLQLVTVENNTNDIHYNNNIEINISDNVDTRKSKMKRPNSNNITNDSPKKVKNLSTDVAKKTLRKQKYTKTVKTWLTNVENEKFEDVMELQKNNERTAVEIISDTSRPEKKKDSRNTVQTQLTNKGGVMKFGKPKRNELLHTTKDYATQSKVAGDFGDTNKEKIAKSKFTPPVNSQIPLKNISYNVIHLNDENFKEYITELNTVNDKEINMILIFSNGFSQLNSHHSGDPRVVKGVIFQINDVFYYWKHVCKAYCSTMERIINNNTIVCFDGKSLLKYFSQRDIDVVSTKVNVLDVQIGGSLIDPSNPPENFRTVQKLLSFVPEYTIATECAQQKHAWYLTMLGECFVRLRSLLIDYELWKVFVQIEMRVLPIVADMERRGVRVDTERLASMESLLVGRMKKAERACHAAAGRAFLPNSALQVRNILYEELRLDVRSNLKIRETLCKGDKSTSETMLRGLMVVHPLPKLILEYRHIHKAHATFLAGIAHQVKDGVVRPTWQQTAAVTGRIACNNPNLQAIPKAPFDLVLFPSGSTEAELVPELKETLSFRSVYVPREGHVLLAADFKHIECRVFAHAAADTSLLDALASPDLFRVLAAKWLNKSEEDVGSEDRERTKRMVYASLYGAGAGRLMEILGVSYDQTLSVVASFNRTFPSLKSFGRAVVAACEQRGGRLATLCGRGRSFPNMFSDDFALKSHAERQAINFIVQGTAADLCKLAMVETAIRLRGAEPPVRGHLLLQIHDELVWEVERQDVGRAAAEIKLAMEGIGSSCGMAATLPVAISIGRTWGDMEQFTPTSQP